MDEKEKSVEDLAVDTLNKCEKPFYFDAESGMLFSKDGKMIAEVRGWGWIEKLDNPEARQDAVGNFMAELINRGLNNTKK